MKTCKTCLISKPYTEFYKNSNRPGLRTECKVCYTARSMVRHILKPLSKEVRVKNSKKFRADNPGYNAKACAKYLATHWDESLARNASNKALRRAMTKSITKEEKVQINQFYLNCPEGYEVDHIIPIKGKTVSGLHVLANLQYLTKHENRSKSNRLVG